MTRWLRLLIVTFVVGLLIAPLQTFAQAPAPAPTKEPTPVEKAQTTAEAAQTGVKDLVAVGDILWICVAAFLVFFMQMGFACVESGLTRAKNTCNIMMKNLMDFCIGSVVFWAVGFGLMFGPNPTGFIGTEHFFVTPEAKASETATETIYKKPVNYTYAFLMFQTVFAATAATIVSGAMAERTKFSAYLIYSAVISAFVYPISGSWAWGSSWAGNGWLGATYIDFAGSSVVHLCGGVAALAGAIVVGPRKGKFNPDGSANAIPGHNIPLAFVGVFVLWLGWFGFNPGSTVALGTGDFARIAVVTNMAGCTGTLGAMFTAWAIFKKPEVTMTMNGALGGLVAVTAGCNVMTIPGALVLGALAGALVVFAVLFFDKIKVDDPVGAVSVHCVCGGFGTLMCGVPFFCFKDKAGSFVTQAIGVGSIAGYTFVVMLIVFFILKYTVGLRVSDEEQVEGLDGPEHGNVAYPDFMLISEH